jgi:hypothetical protein
MAIVYRKSLKGVAEIETRSHRLAPRQRAALILVDGRKTDLELAALIPGEPQAALAGLLADGFIEVVATLAERPAERKPAPAAATAGSSVHKAAGTLEATRRDAVRQLNDQLGPSAEGLAIRIERCASMAELQTLLAQAVQLLHGVRGKTAAEAFAARFIADA